MQTDIIHMQLSHKQNIQGHSHKNLLEYIKIGKWKIDKFTVLERKVESLPWRCRLEESWNTFPKSFPFLNCRPDSRP